MWNLFGKKKKESEHRTLQLITDKGMPFGYVEAYKSLLSVVTDAAVIGRYVDGAMFVVRSDYAPADAVCGAVKKLQDAGVKVLGSVLTRYDMKKALKGSSYAYSYAYNYNYAYGKQDAAAGK